MAIKVEGILARPGEYVFGNMKEIKTAKELKVIARDQGLIDLTLGHPENKMVEKKDFLGSVKPTWDEQKQLLLGNFWFKDEHLHKIPPDILTRIKKGQPVGVSMGYMFEKEGDVLKDMHLNHVALLQPDQEGICPLNKCGVNVRMESENTQFRYEQATEIPDKEPKEAEDKETVQTPPSVTFTKEQFDQLLEAIRPVVPEPPAEQKPEVEETVIEEVPVEPSTPTPPEPRMEPEKVISTGTSPSTEDYPLNDDTVAVSVKMLADKESK